MSRVKTQKTVYLDFLGDEYKEAYVAFDSMSTTEYRDYVYKRRQMEQNSDDGNPDEVESVDLMLDIVQSHFRAGKFPDESGNLFDLKKEELAELELDTVLKLFRRLTGEDTDPK